MAPVGIYPTEPVAGKIVSYWRCELLHFMRYGAESWLANAQ